MSAYQWPSDLPLRSAQSDRALRPETVSARIGDHLDIVAERIADGQDLWEAIEEITRNHHMLAGSILCGIGGLKKCRIRVPVITPGQPRYINPGIAEIAALQGTLSSHSAHCHIAVCDEQGRMWGGHLSKGCIVRMTCELVIAKHDALRFDRQHDLTTGYDELVVTELGPDCCRGGPAASGRALGRRRRSPRGRGYHLAPASG